MALTNRGEKLQKVLARRGLGSRRKLEKLIIAGKVKVNNRAAVIGQRIKDTDIIHLNSRRVKNLKPHPASLLLYNKPLGEVSSYRDERGRPTIFARLPKPPNGRWINIGRLDLNSSGLIMFTTDGELANKLMHPSSRIDREYAVRILGRLSAGHKAKLMTGVELDDGPARFDDIVHAGGGAANNWYHVVLREGRNREVRRMFAGLGFSVSRLIRVRFGPFVLGKIPAGKFKLLARQDVDYLEKYLDKCKCG